MACAAPGNPVNGTMINRVRESLTVLRLHNLDPHLVAWTGVWAHRKPSTGCQRYLQSKPFLLAFAPFFTSCQAQFSFMTPSIFLLFLYTTYPKYHRHTFKYQQKTFQYLPKTSTKTHSIFSMAPSVPVYPLLDQMKPAKSIPSACASLPNQT